MRRITHDKIDIVHCHGFEAILHAVPAARLGKTAIIQTAHGLEPWRVRKQGTVILNPRTLLRQSFWVDRQLDRFIDHYIAVSNAVADHLIKNKRISPDKVSVIRNGRDMTRFRPLQAKEIESVRLELGLSTESKVIAAVGRLHHEKGQPILLNAIARLAHRWPALVALILGTGPLESQLRERAQKLGINSRIRFLGHVANPERILGAADVTVVPSLSDALPNVVLEALGTARPVVASNVGGIPEIITHNQTGLIVPPGDAQSLAEAIERILRDPGLGELLGAAGRTRVQRDFDSSVQEAATAKLYREVLSRKCARVTRQPVSGEWSQPKWRAQ